EICEVTTTGKRAPALTLVPPSSVGRSSYSIVACASMSSSLSMMIGPLGPNLIVPGTPPGTTLSASCCSSAASADQSASPVVGSADARSDDATSADAPADATSADVTSADAPADAPADATSALSALAGTFATSEDWPVAPDMTSDARPLLFLAPAVVAAAGDLAGACMI